MSAAAAEEMLKTARVPTSAPSSAPSGLPSASQSALKETRHEVVFYINGKRHAPKSVEPDLTLIDYLRDQGLTGTKLACGEGGCGACTVTVAHWDQERGEVVHRALNSCLVPVCFVDGMEVTTVEGLGSTRSGKLHPVQDKMANLFGSQCGFCTPGFVMSIHSALQKFPAPSLHQLEKSIDGNLCRCTGYRPIVDALRSLEKEYKGKQSETLKKLHHFPQELIERSTHPLAITGTRAAWFRPTTLEHLLELKATHHHAKIVVGNTEIGIEQRFGRKHYPILISAAHIPELNQVAFLDGGVEVGSAVPLTTLWESLEHTNTYLSKNDQGKDAFKTRSLAAITEQLQWFSGTSIRNGACLGGNIVTASPISDLNPVFVALNAQFRLKSMERGERVVNASDFFQPGYRKVDLHHDEVLTSVVIPYSHENQYVEAYKQARRREDDIAIVNAGFNVALDDSGRVTSARLAFGGLAPFTLQAKETQAFLVGKQWNQDTFENAVDVLRKEVTLKEGTPGGMEKYRTTLALSFFFKYYLAVAQKMKNGPVIPPSYLSALWPLTAESPKGKQVFAGSDQPVVGQSIVHASAERQVTGEAVYIDDMPRLQGELNGSLVVSQRPHAKLRKVDASKALQVPGVIGFFSHKDIPGEKIIGDIVHDEEVFASEVVETVGQPIGIIVAEDEVTAKHAAHLVEVEYEDLEPIFSIEEAVAKQSFFPLEKKIEKGNVAKGLAESKNVVEGRVRIGGQEHFYFEPQITIAQPLDTEMVLYASTQNANKTQKHAAAVLDMPENKVSCSLRRIGGGFGGKESSNIIYSCCAAVAAHHLNRPVRLLLGRDEDMEWTGKRHPFEGTYKAGYDNEGNITAVDVQLYNNGGYSHDLSWPVLERALFHSDNVYNVPHFRVKGRVCKTNLPSNTAFRGFGGPQGMIVTEAWVEHIAHQLKMEPEDVRKKNMYLYEDKTHFGQPINLKLHELWDQCEAQSDLRQRKKAIAEFNRENRFRKRGISMIPTKFGISFTFTPLNQGSSLVNVYTDGTVLITHGGVEMGQGLHTKVMQVAANALGVGMKDVHVSETATDKIPNASATAASQGTDLYCMATFNACEILNERLAPFREKMPGASFKELVQAAWFDRVNLSAQAFYKVPVSGFNFETGEGKPFCYFTSGVAATEVQIDTLTGDYRPLRTDIVMDVGKSINPAIDVGQIEGAFVQGAGWLTMEELVWGDKDHPWVRPGRLRTNGPGAYKIPSCDDIPREFNITLMKDSSNPSAIHSSRAIGEPPLFLGSSALFAIRNAIGAARKDEGLDNWLPVHAPLTAERIRMACTDGFTKSVLDGQTDFFAKGSF